MYGSSIRTSEPRKGSRLHTWLMERPSDSNADSNVPAHERASAAVHGFLITASISPAGRFLRLKSGRSCWPPEEAISA